MPTTTNDAVSYAARRLGPRWQLVLDIAARVTDRGLELPEISEPDAVDTYIDEHVTVARAAEIRRQTANIVAEIAPPADVTDGLKLGRIAETLGGHRSSAGSTLADLFGGTAGERDAAEHAGPTALQHQVRAQLYGKALAVGPEATPAELWEKITALATDPA